MGYHSPGQALVGLPCCPASGCVGDVTPHHPHCVPRCTPWDVWGSHSPQWAFQGWVCRAPCLWEGHRREWSLHPPAPCELRWSVGREQQMLCEGSLEERHLLRCGVLVGRDTERGASAQSRAWDRGGEGSPELLSGCWQPESPSHQPATGQEGQSSHMPSCPALPAAWLSGRAARRSARRCTWRLPPSPPTPGRQSCSLSPQCPSCGAARNPQEVWGRRGECSAPWVLSLCHVGSGFSVCPGLSRCAWPADLKPCQGSDHRLHPSLQPPVRPPLHPCAWAVPAPIRDGCSV